MPDTGNGATIALGTTGGTYAVQKISISEVSVNMLDISTLASAGYKEEMPEALKSLPEITVDFLWEDGQVFPDPGSAEETVTITFPGNDTLAGTAHVSAVKYPDAENGAVMMGQFKVKFNGNTGPAYTIAS
jgi:hypothetical protein